MKLEEATRQLDRIQENLAGINFDGIAAIFKRNEWQWGGHDEPKYIPEYRDIKRHIYYMFNSVKKEFLAEFTETDKCRRTETSCGRIQAILYLEDDTLNLSFCLDDTLATVCDEEASNFIDNEGWDYEEWSTREATES